MPAPPEPGPAAPPPPELPGDVELGPPTRPVHLTGANIALVAAGGAVGTGLRYAIGVLIPAVAQLPLGTLLVNVLGAFALGALLETLVNRDGLTTQRLRLGLGTGALGGFTTYSTLALDTVRLTTLHPGWAIGYALGTLVLGLTAAAAGIRTARRVRR